MASNHKPAIHGVDEGIWRRIRLVPFTATIPAAQRDPRLESTLKDELSGILAWAVRGCLAWQQHRLAEPTIVQQATAQYRDDEDILGDFLSECIGMAANVHTRRSIVYQRYVAWCSENGMRPITQRKFGESLTDRGWERGKSNGHSTWKGVRLIQMSGSTGCNGVADSASTAVQNVA